MPDIVTSETFADGERGITASKMNQIISGAVIQPAFYSAKPSSSTLDPTDVLLELKGTGAYAQITGSNLINSVAASVSSTRPRSFNAIGNPSFEVDQRNVGTAVACTPTVPGLIDRWGLYISGTTRGTSQQIAANVTLPGTNFYVTQNIFRFTLTTRSAALAATDSLYFQQIVEGPQLRELLGDVHSVSILARSSVANLTFGYWINNAASTYYLTKLCTLGAANTWTLIQLPNLPLWTASASWGLTPGVVGYILGITLAAGTSVLATANDLWQSGGHYGALGQANFSASPVNSTFDLAFVQHEPGALCTTLIDRPFTQNYNECLRYYSKSYAYGIKPGVAITGGTPMGIVPAGYDPIFYVPFKTTMSKTPTILGYGPGSGLANMALDLTAAVDRPIVAVYNPADSGFGGFQTSTHNAGPAQYEFHYTSDTGW